MSWLKFQKNTMPLPGWRIIGINENTKEWVQFTVFQYDHVEGKGADAKVVMTKEAQLEKFINTFELTHWMVPSI